MSPPLFLIIILYEMVKISNERKGEDTEVQSPFLSRQNRKVIYQGGPFMAKKPITPATNMEAQNSPINGCAVAKATQVQTVKPIAPNKRPMEYSTFWF